LKTKTVIWKQLKWEDSAEEGGGRDEEVEGRIMN